MLRLAGRRTQQLGACLAVCGRQELGVLVWRRNVADPDSAKDRRPRRGLDDSQDVVLCIRSCGCIADGVASACQTGEIRRWQIFRPPRHPGGASLFPFATATSCWPPCHDVLQGLKLTPATWLRGTVWDGMPYHVTLGWAEVGQEQLLKALPEPSSFTVRLSKMSWDPTKTAYSVNGGSLSQLLDVCSSLGFKPRGQWHISL